jgi:two-component system phosphate regulon response regulator PhoB
MNPAVTQSKVLLVEDEADVRDLMLLHLKRDGIQAEAVEDGEAAARLLQNGKYDLVILDWMLPGLSGLEICKRARSGSLGASAKTAPILMVTARADTSDIVIGLEMGADDYVTKPFEIPVFLARVRSLIRRGRAVDAAGPVIAYEVGPLKLNIESHDVRCGSDPLDLTPSEFKLLAALMSNQGRVLSRERLIDLVQGQGVAVVDRAIDTHVFGLRKKLGACAEIVETIRGVGYRVRALD